MSLYTTHVGIVKIKPKFIDDFQALFDEKHELIKDPNIKSVFREAAISRCLLPLKEWQHWNEKKEWIGKYKTHYEDGVFTYGICFNTHGSCKRFYFDFLYDILPYVTEQVVEKDSWMEN